jgi:isoquinoline 1-oxidoreductase beta subunit
VRGASLPPTGRSLALNAWLKLDTDGRVTVTTSKSEMGQGVHAALLMLVAEELDCGW